MIDERYGKITSLMADFIYKALFADLDEAEGFFEFGVPSYCEKVFKAVAREYRMNNLVKELEKDSVWRVFCKALKTSRIDLDFLSFQIDTPENFGKEFYTEYRENFYHGCFDTYLNDRDAEAIEIEFENEIRRICGGEEITYDILDENYYEVANYFEGELAIVNVPEDLSEILDAYMIRHSPSVVATYLTKVDGPNHTVTYYYSGCFNYDTGNGMVSTASVEAVNLLFFLPLVIEQAKLKRKGVDKKRRTRKSSGVFLSIFTIFSIIHLLNRKLNNPLLFLLFSVILWYNF